MPNVYTNALVTDTPLTTFDLAIASRFNSITNQTNGIHSQLTRFGNSLQVSSSATSITLFQNKDVSVLMTNTSNSTVTLPAATGQYKTILIKKAAFNNATITITRAGSDTIEDPNNPLTTPTATTFVLYGCDDFVELEARGTTWRIVSLNRSNNIRAGAYMSTNQSLVINTYTEINFNTIESDVGNIGGFFNTSTKRFLPLVAGTYLCSAAVYTYGSSTGGVITEARKNGNATTAKRTWTNGGVGTGAIPTIFVLNGTTDYVSFFEYFDAGGTRDILGNRNSSHCFFQKIA